MGRRVTGRDQDRRTPASRSFTACLVVTRGVLLLLLMFIAHTNVAAAQPASSSAAATDLWAQTQLQQGHPLDFNARCGATPVSSTDSKWNNACRILTGRQLAALLETAPANGSAESPELRIVGLHVAGNVDLRGSAVPRTVSLQKSHLDGSLLLSNSHFEGSLLLEQVAVAGGLTGHDIQVDGALQMTDSQFGGSVILRSARIGHDLTMNGSSFAVDLNIDSAAIGGNLFLENAFLAGWLLLSNPNVDRNSGAKIDQSVFLSGTTFKGPIVANETRIGQDLNLSSTTSNGVWLIAADIGGFLKLSGSTFNGIVQAGNVRVGESIVAYNPSLPHRVYFHGPVYLDAARVGANVSMDDAHFDQSVSATELNVRGQLTATHAVFNKATDLSASRIGGNLDLAGARFAKTLDATDLDVNGRFDLSDTVMAQDLHLARGRVGDSLDLHGAQFFGVVDLTAMTIGNDLTLVAFSHGKPVQPVRWMAAAPAQNVLFLYNAHIGSLTDGQNAWPAALHFYINGLTYRSLSNWPIVAREHWVDRSNVNYRPQPYRQLAAELAASGNRNASLEVQFHGRRQERITACQHGYLARCISMGILEFTIGYGIGPYAFRVVPWVLGLIVLGWIILLASASARRKGLIWCIGASCDRLLPVIELNAEFKDFFNDPERRRLRGWQLCAFALIGILGWALSLFLIAALTGLTQSG